MAGPITPMVLLGGVVYANDWYNGGSPTHVTPLLYAGISATILELFGAIPGMEPVATMIGWTAFVGMMIAPTQNGKNSPVNNLLKLTNQKPVSGLNSIG
jgi:hypothetical protein